MNRLDKKLKTKHWIIFYGIAMYISFISLAFNIYHVDVPRIIVNLIIIIICYMVLIALRKREDLYPKILLFDADNYFKELLSWENL